MNKRFYVKTATEMVTDERCAPFGNLGHCRMWCDEMFEGTRDVATAAWKSWDGRTAPIGVETAVGAIVDALDEWHIHRPRVGDRVKPGPDWDPAWPAYTRGTVDAYDAKGRCCVRWDGQGGDAPYCTPTHSAAQRRLTVVFADVVTPASVTATPAPPIHADAQIVAAEGRELMRRERIIDDAYALGEKPALGPLLRVEVNGTIYTMVDVRAARTRELFRLVRESARNGKPPSQPNCLDDHEEAYYHDADEG